MADPIMFWRYGWHRSSESGIDGAGDFEAISFEEASDKLGRVIADAAADAIDLIEDRHRHEVVRKAWTAFDLYVQTLTELGGDYAAIGPDRVTYWVHEIRH